MGIFDDFLCGCFGEPTVYDHFLVLQSLVVGEEIFRRADPVRIKVSKGVVFTNMAHWYTDDLVVLVTVVGHVQYGDWLDLDERAGLNRYIVVYNNIERIIIQREGLRDEPIGRCVTH